MVSLTLDFWVLIAAASLAYAVPLIIAGLGENFSQLSGVLNIGVEGFMLAGALTGFLVTYYTGNPWIGLFTGLIAGIMLSLVNAIISINIGASQFVSGIGIYIFAFGFTAFWFKSFVENVKLTGASSVLTINYPETLHVPFLAEIPIVGKILFQQSLLVYIALAMVPLFWFLVYRTMLGLKIRAVGESPESVESAGFNVYRLRYLAVIISGALSGLGGAYFSVVYLHIFIDGVTAGIGFIVLAIIIAANWAPHKILVIAYIFSFINILQLRLPILGIPIPYQILMMQPYLITIIILVIFRRVSMPQVLTIPYKKEK